ncbi:MAG: prephenate dehydrogenase/arogenate dehydrogenase family protein [Candidatus Bathyarchaeia archaeon]|nr:prephenate dehydrogenase/arogenate dehydrogenase family protein [Candidatus Bathyarchaeia archaeon]
MKTAILGAGKMGVWFARFCRENGEEVIISDRKEEKLARIGKEIGVETDDFLGAVKKADNVIICVSIDAFEEVVKKIAPSVREGQTVVDICSIKERPVKIMHHYLGKALVLGTHPVFGPGSRSVKNKAFILTPTNSEEETFAGKYKKWLEKMGARVFTMSPRKHDELMSVVLGFPHFLGLVACDTLLEQTHYPESKKVAGTTYQMLFTLAEATAMENPELFSSLQFNLPAMQNLEKLLIEKAGEWLQLIKQKDTEAVAAKMNDLKSKLMKASCNFEKSYEIMYKMLEAAEN